ncbi:hypothetical protein PR202_ga23715 [Eleusine coracana subsp. coracana]|uniref:Uncharacterized protein n=1 Tax=Eleusine coracana subsp. coracana TaxID=191504 RepID=A0AAV5D6X9_ELECO|nr:hypothetical protein PR202_ga23715 [Eleusine coracana subsp. coracana]
MRQPLRRAVRVRQPAAAGAGVLPAAAAGVLTAAAGAGVQPAAGDADYRLPAAAVGRRRRLRADAGVHADAGVQPDAVRVGLAVHADVQHAAGNALPAGPGLPAQRRRRPPRSGLARGARRGRTPGGLVMAADGGRKHGNHHQVHGSLIPFRVVDNKIREREFGKIFFSFGNSCLFMKFILSSVN